MNFLITVLLILLLDLFALRGIGFVFPRFAERRRRGIRMVLAIQIVFSFAVVVGGFFLSDRTRDYRVFAVYYYLFGLMLMLYVPKALFAVSLIPDVVAARRHERRQHIRHLFPKPSRHIPAKCGIALGMAYIVLMIWGVFYERYHYQVNRVEIACDALPAKFDGFKIVQISDLHAGSLFGSVHRMERLTDMVNRQQADIIVFTGDFVNNFAEEIVPVIPIFSRMEALTGKFAILGNHDYGIYYKWETPAGKAKNQQELEKNIALMGFDLLKNRATVIEKDSANRIAIAGVENWGIRKRHPKLGNIATATASVQDVPFKILLSHDPSFWQEHIKGKTDIPLTLSGHTHGMQMGVRLGEKRYSPAQMAHTYFAGLYRENDQYLYVNTGLGVIGFPGRIGMPPEITVITLKTRL